MTEQITLTISLDAESLKRTANMLQNMAINMEPITHGIGNTVISPDSDLDTTGMAIESKISANNGGTMQPITSDLDKPLAPLKLNAKSASIPLPPGIVELDSAKRPWDERINTEEKTKKADGVWKLKRKIHTKHPGLVEKVYAELDAVPTVDNSSATLNPAEVFGNVQPVTPVAAVVPVTPVTTAQPVVTFQEFISKTTERQMAKPDFVDKLEEILSNNNVTIPDLMEDTNASILQTVNNELEAIWITLT